MRPVDLALPCRAQLNPTRNHRRGIPGNSRAEPPADHEQRPGEEELWERAVKRTLDRHARNVGGEGYVLLRSGQLGRRSLHFR